MKLGKITFVVICVSACTAICLGQTNKTESKPNLNGTWELDQKRSNFGKSKSSSNSPEQMKITHADPELRITRRILVNGQMEERELTYYTDGRGETNPTTAYITTKTGVTSEPPAKTRSKTTWKGNKIVSSSGSLLFDSVPIQFQIVVEWRLSSDTKTLTQTTQIFLEPDPKSLYVSVNRAGEGKAVYNLVSK